MDLRSHPQLQMQMIKKKNNETKGMTIEEK